MRLSSDERVLYAQAVWETFEHHNPRPGGRIMSSAEFSLICRWISLGIPLAVVLRGIEDMGPGARTLLACAQPVEREHARWFHAIGGTE